MFEKDNTPVWLGGLVAAAAIALVASYSQVHGIDQAIDQAAVPDLATGRTATPSPGVPLLGAPTLAIPTPGAAGTAAPR